MGDGLQRAARKQRVEITVSDVEARAVRLVAGWRGHSVAEYVRRSGLVCLRGDLHDMKVDERVSKATRDKARGLLALLDAAC